MTERIEFARKATADDYREQYEEHLCSEDDARLKTVAFSSDTPDGVLEEAEAAAMSEQARADAPSLEQVALTDQEKRDLDLSRDGVNIPKARYLKGLGDEYGVDAFQHVDPAEIDTVTDARPLLEDASQTGGIDRGGGAEYDDEAEERRERERRANAEGHLAEGCDNARDHCEDGDPSACEFLTEECGLEPAEAERIKGLADEPLPAADADATPRGEPGDDVPGEALGALKRSWGGYTAAVNDAEQALEAAAAHLDHAEDAARAIHALEDEHGLESEPFVRLLEVHRLVEDLHARHDLHRDGGDGLEPTDDGMVPEDGEASEDTHTDRLEELATDDLRKLADASDLPTDDDPSRAELLNRLDAGAIDPADSEVEPEGPPDRSRDPEHLPKGFQGAMGAVVLSHIDLEADALECASWTYPRLYDSDDPAKGLRLCRDGDGWSVERWDWMVGEWEPVGSYDALTGAAGAMGHYSRDIAHDEGDLIQDLGTILPDRATDISSLEYDLLGERNEDPTGATWGAWQYDPDSSTVRDEAMLETYVWRLERPHHEAVGAADDAAAAAEGGGQKVVSAYTADLLLEVSGSGRIRVAFDGAHGNNRSSRTLHASYSLRPADGSEWTLRGLLMETADALMQGMKYGPKADALEDHRDGHDWKGPVEVIDPGPPGVAPGSADRDAADREAAGLETVAEHEPAPALPTDAGLPRPVEGWDLDTDPADDVLARWHQSRDRMDGGDRAVSVRDGGDDYHIRYGALDELEAVDLEDTDSLEAALAWGQEYVEALEPVGNPPLEADPEDDGAEFNPEKQGTLEAGVEAEEVAEETQATLEGENAESATGALPAGWRASSDWPRYEATRWEAGPYSVVVAGADEHDTEGPFTVTLTGAEASHTVASGIRDRDRAVKIGREFTNRVAPPEVSFESDDATVPQAAAEAKRETASDEGGLSDYQEDRDDLLEDDAGGDGGN